ncbi:DNA alkylation repair protein [Acetatifactor muris]|uniref:DNA alkylation repair enzyme n=1 Tax=Acetatifactor muris TaxID=879566 RepID=A0A2K4ZBP8_9FIRM|nr:DNA alkylation repair protein [Acetatifactor muris]MCR2046026.1 DNA alkylation repair protein [Acetatifactor muris]SOY27871.1 DNA alkylation repair enzyme [Acetatifactor muris]
MDGQEMINELRAQASEKYRENMIRMGIPAENSIGVATSVVRGLAKKAGKSQELAFELWNTKYHEARMLAHEWMEGESKALRWIGKDAAKELETMVKAEGRGRLISANTRMGKESGGSG